MNSRSKPEIDVPHLGVVDVSGIRNRNEKRVISCLPEVLAEYPDFHPDRIGIQDIYALSLNKLPPRYTQAFSIVLHDPVSDDEVRNAVRSAVEHVRSNPK